MSKPWVSSDLTAGEVPAALAVHWLRPPHLAELHARCAKAIGQRAGARLALLQANAPCVADPLASRPLFGCPAVCRRESVGRCP